MLDPQWVSHPLVLGNLPMLPVFTMAQAPASGWDMLVSVAAVHTVKSITKKQLASLLTQPGPFSPATSLLLKNSKADSGVVVCGNGLR